MAGNSPAPPDEKLLVITHPPISNVFNENRAIKSVFLAGTRFAPDTDRKSEIYLTTALACEKEIPCLLPHGIQTIALGFIPEEENVQDVDWTSLTSEDSPKLDFAVKYNRQGDCQVICTGNELQPFAVAVRETAAISSILWQENSLLRCQLELSVPIYVSEGDVSESIQIAFQRLHSDLDSTRGFFILEPPSCSDDGYLVPVAGETPAIFCKELIQPKDFITLPGGIQIPRPWNAKLRFLQENDGGVPSVQYSPVEGGITQIHRLEMKIDVLSLAPRTQTLQKVCSESLLQALHQQVDYMRQLADSKALAPVVKLEAFHFCPPGFIHPITAVYDLTFGESQKQSVDARMSLHRLLQLPLDRPLLRIANAIDFNQGLNPKGVTPSAGRRLQDVHLGLTGSQVPGGVKSLVQGSYEYYHYMQDRLDDSGWGCAYRSLQTIISWFKLQHYTSIPVPSHRKIQQTLVEIGDKDVSFVGSSQWIGAIELGYVLDQLLGVTCKVLTVQSGADMPTKGRELAHHFRTQGTPVMIGGGVLAYTLLGVEYNELTGECAFLILDPHYVGGEDLRSIKNGGWVGWKKMVSQKGKEFFVRNAFYNLLLPQRPTTV